MSLRRAAVLSAVTDQRCDLLVGLDGLHVLGVDRDDRGALTITVESPPS